MTAPAGPAPQTGLTGRIAGAPITWGVCEVPGWGHQLEPEVVLRQMHDIGLVATELGPEGFLPADPEAAAAVLRQHGLSAVGQFVPVVLHDAGADPLPQVERAMDGLLACGASTVVLAAATGLSGYDARPELTQEDWDTVLAHLDAIDELARARGLLASLHPHVGTMVESPDEVERVLAGSRIGLCLDTGHLLVGGGDPVAVAQQHPDRVGHVHLKDVALPTALRVRSGEISYTEGVRDGMYRPLGEGDLDLAALVTALERSGYDGWYVLEQDTILEQDPASVPGAPDPSVDARASVECLLALAAEVSG